MRAPYRGRSTPVNAWWGSFDLAVSLFSGNPAEPPSEDFIMRNAMDAQEVAITPNAAHWDRDLGEYLLEWDDVRQAEHPHAAARDFARSAVRHACVVCGWDRGLATSVDGRPPPVQ